MYGVFGYARKLLIVKVKFIPRGWGWMRVFSGNRSFFVQNKITVIIR